MSVRFLPIDEILQLLTIAPSKIATATAGLSDEILAQPPAPDEWSPNFILAHLRACQDTWGDVRVARMLAEDLPTIRAVNPNTWLTQTDYRDLPFSVSLAAFTQQRAHFVDLLENVTLADWARSGTFTGGGKPRRHTVNSEADALARHERSHVKQFERLCGRLRR